MNISDIKQDLLNQNLSGLGFYSTEFNNKFQRLVTPTGIDEQLSEAVLDNATSVFPIFYLLYDSVQNILKLKVHRFTYVNELWTHHSSNIMCDVTWNYSSTDNKYLINYQMGSKIGYSFNRDIPFIEKTEMQFVCGGTIVDGIVGFVYQKHDDGNGGYYYVKVSNNPQPPCCSELQLDNCGQAYPGIGICVQSECCIDNISVC